MISREKDYSKFYTKLTCSCFGCSTFVRQPPSWTCGLWKLRPQSSTYRDGDRKRPSCFWRQTFVGSILGQSKTWKNEKINKKLVKLTDHYYACNSSTNFECERMQPPETENVANLLNLVWKKKKKNRKITTSKIILELWKVYQFSDLSRKKIVILYPSAIDNFRGLIKPTCIRDEN